MRRTIVLFLVSLLWAAGTVRAQATNVKTVSTALDDYVIGPEDQLSIVFLTTRDMSVDVVVRPDGKISLPIINDVRAAGLTPDELRQAIMDAAKRFVQDPTATVLVRQINSRKVFITGTVSRPGSYPLNAPTTVLQLIATAGGVTEYADPKRIVVIRTTGAQQQTVFDFNYNDVVNKRRMEQNIWLRPGDMVVVP